jgi:hypothetical protein
MKVVGAWGFLGLNHCTQVRNNYVDAKHEESGDSFLCQISSDCLIWYPSRLEKENWVPTKTFPAMYFPTLHIKIICQSGRENHKQC